MQSIKIGGRDELLRVRRVETRQHPLQPLFFLPYLPTFPRQGVETFTIAARLRELVPRDGTRENYRC